MTRQAKTPRQRAEEALGVAQRHAKRLRGRRDALVRELEDVNADYAAAEARRVYLAKHPDLQDTPPTTTSTGAPQ